MNISFETKTEFDGFILRKAICGKIEFCKGYFSVEDMYEDFDNFNQQAKKEWRK